VLDKVLERLWALQVVGVRCEAQGLLVVEPFEAIAIFGSLGFPVAIMLLKIK
jgi:hypothetical protein